MVAISSRKPAAPGSKYDQLQKLAEKSWEGLFEEVLWDRSDNVPAIANLAALGASRQSWQWACLINSDIVLAPVFKELGPILWKLGAVAAVSRRFEFNVDHPFPQKTKSVDEGLDCFVALPGIWTGVVNLCPKEFKLGKPQWDTWLHGFLNHYHRKYYYDFSKWGCVFHPKHERKEWIGTPLDIPWDLNDLDAAQELPLPEESRR